MSASTASAIEVRAVTKTFGSVKALDAISFTVAPGDLFFLLGPSGCGKTTLLRILAGLETPDSGEVFFHGEDILRQPPHRRGAPMVFQNYALFPHLSVRENVAFGLVERRMPRQGIDRRVEEALERVDLAGLDARRPGQLSGGQQQRVVLARALVLEPRIVLLDEPLSNLDAKLRAEMRDEIMRLHEETEITFVYVTHDQVEALSLADRMVVMNAGLCAGAGAPRELYHRPPNRFCAEFLGEANLVAGRVDDVSGDRATVDTPLGTWVAVSPGSAPAVGAPCLCLIRPENLVRTTSEDGNSFEATVRQVRMNGTTVTAHLEADGVELRAVLLNRFVLDLEPGTKALWHAAAVDTVLLPGGNGA